MEHLSELARSTLRLVKEAGEIAQKLREGIETSSKPDGSIVTNADRAVETFLRDQLLALTPGAGFWGEEFGYSEPTDAGFWVLDPIDGTSNFASRQPLWGVTCGFLVNGRTQIGVVVMPDLRMELIAERGKGAFLNGDPLPPIPTGEIGPTELMGHGDSRAALQNVSPGKMRHLGAYCVEVAFVATQQLRALTTGRVRLYDCAGGNLICQELGAEIREIDGTPWHEGDWQKPERCRPFYVGPRESNFPFGKADSNLVND